MPEGPPPVPHLQVNVVVIPVQTDPTSVLIPVSAQFLDDPIGASDGVHVYYQFNPDNSGPFGPFTLQLWPVGAPFDVSKNPVVIGPGMLPAPVNGFSEFVVLATPSA